MLNAVKVIFSNPDYNYTTSVSALVSELKLRAYFIGAPMNMGNDNIQFVKDIELIKTRFEVIDGAFIGETGIINGSMNPKLVFIQNDAGDRMLVTPLQIKEIN